MKMKQIQEAVFIFAALFTLSVIAYAQDEYVNCSSNYTVLENALLGTSDNLFQMSTTFFNPEYINPVYVDVFYHFGDTNTPARYKWSASSLYLIVPPSALQYLSLFFSYFEKGSTAKLNLQLPVDCIELKNVTNSTKQDFLLVLTQRLQIFAKYYRSLDRITLPAGFIARVVSYEEQDKIFDTNSGTLVAFSFSLTFPIITFVFLVIYVGGLFSYVIKSNILKKDDHHPTQAALVCVGQSYTLYVVIMDVIAATKSEITPYLRGVIISLAAVEFVLFLVIIVFICILCDHQRFKKREKCFQYMYFPLFCTRVTKMDVRQWFVIVGLIPALVCLSSHIGFIIEGWVSSNSRGTAVMLLYSCLFVFLFIVFQSMYSVLTNIRNKKKNTGPQRVDSGNPTIQDPERRSLLQRNQQKGTEQQYLDFCSLAIELLPGIPILGGILAYIGYGVFHVPIIRGAEDVVTHVYNLGETASIFVVFLITYLIFLYKGEYRGPIRPFNPLQRRSSV